jgi:hypothetical protein
MRKKILTSAIAETPPEHVLHGGDPGNKNFARRQLARGEDVRGDTLEIKKVKKSRKKYLILDLRKKVYLRHVPHVEGVFDGQVTRFHELQVQIPEKKPD